jgi:predicted acetyltransferase
VSTVAQVRRPTDDEREEMAILLATSLNVDRGRAVARADRLPIGDMRVAGVEGRIASVAASFPFDQWVGGAALPCCAVWGVATLPEHRGLGLASATTGAVLDAGREGGAVIATLYPATMRPYRRLGFEMAGTFTKHRVAIDAIPPQPGEVPTPELFDPERDLADVRTCYRRYAARHTGPVEPVLDEHWSTRILQRSDDETRRAVVVREHGEVTGFLVTGRRDEAGQLDVAFGLWTEAFVATSETALRSLLAYVRRFAGLGTSFTWSGPPNDPIGMLLDEQAITIDLQLRWMSRLLDVPAAFAQRGWPRVDADATFGVDDPRYPANAGPWRLSVRDGKATIDPDHDADRARRPIPIGALSSMFTGYLRTADAVTIGALDADDPAVPAFARLLAGPDPWSPFFF